MLPDVFAWLHQAGGVADLELLRTFNCGIGMLLCVPEAQSEQALELLREQGEHAWLAGRITRADAEVPAGTLHIGGTEGARIEGTWL